MERALNRDDLNLALGELPEIPDAGELQRLLADAELSLFAGRPDVPDELVRAGWYLHAIASTGGDRVAWPRRQRAFRISAHILELAAIGERPATERLELTFGAELGYRRGGLDPNAAAVFAQARAVLSVSDPDESSWWETIAVEAGVYFLSFRTSETFDWLRSRRRTFTALRGRTGLSDLAGTMFGPSEHVVEACYGILRFLIFGDRPPLEQAQGRLHRILGSDGEPATTNERWVAAHLLALSDELDAGSVWTALPPDVPAAARRALTSTSPPVLTLWEPQRELLSPGGKAAQLLSSSTTRAVLSVPTSAGKTLVAQIIVLAELASSDRSVCLIAPQRSLVREIRRALVPRVRALRKRLGVELPDFLADFAADVLDEDPPDVDVMTPERFAAMLRSDPEAVLRRYGLFVFDEAHLVGDKGRGFTLEGALSYLHWRTRDTDHRIVLMSAAIGNDAAFQAWLQTGAPAQPFRSEWRGPRRLSAAFTTRPDRQAEQHVLPVGRERLHRLASPLDGIISFTVPGAGARSYVTNEPIGELVFKRNSDGTRGRRDERSTPHYAHVAALASFLDHAGPVLTVTGTRADAQRLARALADERDETEVTRRAREAVATMLDDHHPLVTMLARGVAYHHAGLPLEVLALIEDELRAGRLQHLVSTTTLTEGVNLPVHTVVLAETKWEGSDVHISGPRMLNAIGRAGRAGIETEGWVVFAPSGGAPSDPERHLPDPEQLEIRSQLATEETLQHLADFEQRRRDAADAVFSDLPDGLQDFTSFVWYVLACEEALSGVMDDEQLDELVDTLFAARQVNAAVLQELRNFARDVRTTYASSDPARRRAWARAGTRVSSARRLDELAATLAGHAVNRDDRGAVHAAIEILDDSGVLSALLALPDIDANAWRFRVTPRGDDVEVGIADALKRWTSGQSLSSMADDLLAPVPDREWRLEQLVDRVSRGFGHAVSWMISAVLERANLILAEAELTPLCPALPLYVRFGVDSSVALRLLTRAVRSRDVAVRVARAAREAGIDDDHLVTWLGTLPVDQWPGLFAARPSDVLDLLDAISDPQADLLRRLLDSEVVELVLEEDLPPGPVRVVVAAGTDLRLVELHSLAGQPLAVLPARLQADVRTVVATGIDVEATLAEDRKLTLRLIERAV
ncbi:MAG: DEAD/DEAH box helicase [Thermoleophilaceae bacterium]